MTVQRFVALGFTPQPDSIAQPELMSKPDGVRSALQKLKISEPEGQLLVLCPGAEYGPAKQWPAEYFAAVADKMAQQGWSVWLFGSEKDRAIGEEIVLQLGKERRGVENLAGRTTLEQAIDLMSLATVVVGNDSGLMHVAAALDRDLVAIYGSSDPGFTPPLNPRAKILDLSLECSPCFKRECPLGHYDCLRQLEPAQVLGAIGAFAA